MSEPLGTKLPRRLKDIGKCKRLTDHARVYGTDFCACGHAMFDGPEPAPIAEKVAAPDSELQVEFKMEFQTDPQTGERRLRRVGAGEPQTAAPAETKWNWAERDRFHGHIDYGIITPDGLVACPSFDIADQIFKAASRIAELQAENERLRLENQRVTAYWKEVIRLKAEAEGERDSLLARMKEIANMAHRAWDDPATVRQIFRYSGKLDGNDQYFAELRRKAGDRD